jgi:hypothetical protein
MTPWHAHADPPRTLGERLEQLNDNLQSLAQRLKDAIASAISSTIAATVRDLVRSLLGIQEDQRSDNYSLGQRWGNPHDEWYEPDDALWEEEQEHLPVRREPSNEVANKGWQDAARAAVQAGLWWLRNYPCRRPILTTTLVALAAGGTALVAGPTFAACVSVVASVASLVLTADAARSACTILSG